MKTIFASALDFKSEKAEATSQAIDELSPKISYHFGHEAVLHIGFKMGFHAEIVLDDSATIDRRLIEKLSPAVSRSDYIRFELTDLLSIKKAHADLCELIEQGSAALVRVVSAGNGPTLKSKKIRVSATYWNEDGSETKLHTITVPASMLIINDDGIFAPRWFLKKTIHDKNKNGKWPSKIEGGFWGGADQLWESFAPFVNAIDAKNKRKTSSFFLKA